MTTTTRRRALRSGKKVAKSTQPPQAKTRGWNTMSHLRLKRFADDDASLTPGARRDRQRHPHVATAELDPSGRARCKRCGEAIPKASVRLSLWLECHKGYRNLCTLHPACFWNHPETKKIVAVDEIDVRESRLSEAQVTEIRAQFCEFRKACDDDAS